MDQNYSMLVYNHLQKTYDELINDENYYYYYKYMPLDKNTETYPSIDNNTLKFTNPSGFNDPYDSVINILVDNQPHLDQKNFIQKFREKYFISCFTSNPFDILMWSHYANNHCGFVMEFRIPKYEFQDVREKTIYKYPFPVFYENQFPIFNISSNQEQRNIELQNKDKISELLKKSLLTKAECWGYEKELRLAIDKDDLQNTTKLNDNSVLKAYEPKALSSIILGAKTSDVHKADITKSINNFNVEHCSNVNIFNIKLDENEFRLTTLNGPGRFK